MKAALQTAASKPPRRLFNMLIPELAITENVPTFVAVTTLNVPVAATTP